MNAERKDHVKQTFFDIKLARMMLAESVGISMQVAKWCRINAPLDSPVHDKSGEMIIGLNNKEV